MTMTLAEQRSQARLRRVETGVRRIPGPDEPVVIIQGTAAGEEVSDVVLALLSRRRDVFMVPPHTTLDDLPHRFALVVPVGGTTPLVTDDRVSMMVTIGSSSPPARCPTLAINPSGAQLLESGALDIRYAAASHPAELAHLIDAFLRDPRRHPAGCWILRAQP